MPLTNHKLVLADYVTAVLDVTVLSEWHYVVSLCTCPSWLEPRIIINTMAKNLEGQKL